MTHSFVGVILRRFLTTAKADYRESTHRRWWSAGQHPRGSPAEPWPLEADTGRCWPGRFRLVPLRRHQVPATRAPSRTAPRPARSQRTTLQNEERQGSRYREEMMTMGDQNLDSDNNVSAAVSHAAARCYVILLSSIFHFLSYQLTGCSCLWRACSLQDWLWLHFGETEPSGFLESVAPLWWSAGCSG